MLSLAGIPPLAGWFAKFIVIRDAVSTETAAAIVLAVVASIATAIGLYFYLSFIRRLWLDPTANSADNKMSAQSLTPTASLAVVIGLAALALVVAGVFPAFVTDVGGWSSLLK